MGLSFIRAGAVGIESGKYPWYLPDSGQEEKLRPALRCMRVACYRARPALRYFTWLKRGKNDITMPSLLFAGRALLPI